MIRLSRLPEIPSRRTSWSATSLFLALLLAAALLGLTGPAAAQTTPRADQQQARSGDVGLPDPARMLILIRSTMIAFDQANRTGTYSVLRQLASQPFRTANSADELAEIFSAWSASGIDLSPLAVIDPQLPRAPWVDEKGLLRLVGFFPSAPLRIHFDMSFILEHGAAWKLYGLTVTTSQAVSDTPAETAPEPVNDQGAEEKPPEPRAEGTRGPRRQSVRTSQIPIPRERPAQ